MIHALEGGTDAAMMLLFDPDSLPDDYDAQVQHNAAEAVDRGAAEGRLCRLEPEDGGVYTLCVVVGEPLPDDVSGLVQPVAEIERFPVTGGRLFFAGVEYGHRRDDSSLRKKPEMGTFCEIEPGTYRLSVFRLSDPDALIEERLRERTTPLALRLDGILRRWLLPLGTLGVMAGIASLITLGAREWRVTALPVSLAMILPGLLLSLTPAARLARLARRDLGRECADYWAVLEPVA